MKKLLRLLLVSFGFIFLSCDNSTNPNGLYTISGIVFDNSYPDVSPFYKEGVPVILDGDTSISNIFGEFVFKKIHAGTHIISVSLPNYESYQENITISNDTKMEIHLFGIKGDYFPTIPLNSQKRFKYTYLNCRLDYIYRQGEAKWTLDSLIEDNGDLIYYIRETLIYTSTTNGTNPQLDTTITSFKIIDDKSHIIKIVSSIWGGVSFNRFMNNPKGNIIELQMYTSTQCKITLKKDVGIYKMKETPRTCVETTYELIE